LVSDRVYRKSFDHQDALNIIAAERSKSFDGKIVDAMLDAIGAIQGLYDSFSRKGSTDGRELA